MCGYCGDFYQDRSVVILINFERAITLGRDMMVVFDGLSVWPTKMVDFMRCDAPIRLNSEAK